MSTPIPTPLAAFTSIPPRLRRPLRDGGDVGPEYLRACIASWRRCGLEPHSVHYEDERALISDPLPGVVYHFLPRRPEDGANKKPRIATLFAAIAAAGVPRAGIVNADILLAGGPGLGAAMEASAAGGLLIGKRCDVADPFDDAGLAYELGVDLFVFDADLPGRIGDMGLILGEPWWDYWVPLAAAFADVPLRQVQGPLALHLKHPQAYSQALWLAFGRGLHRYALDRARGGNGTAEAFAAARDAALGPVPAELDDPYLLRFANFCVRWIDARCTPVPLAEDLGFGQPAFTPIGALTDPPAWPLGGDGAALLERLGRRAAGRSGRSAPRLRETALLLRTLRGALDGGARDGGAETDAAALAAPLLDLMDADAGEIAALTGAGAPALAALRARLEGGRAAPRLQGMLRLPLAADPGAEVLNGMATVRAWERPDWRHYDEAHFGRLLAADIQHRSGWAWEHAQLLWGAERLGAFGPGRRALVVARLPDPLYVALTEHVAAVEVLNIGDPPATPEKVAEWCQTSELPALAKLRLVHGAEDAPDRGADGFDLVVMPHNTLFAEGWAGAGAMLERVVPLLAPGGVLAIGANALVTGTRQGPWIPAGTLSSGRLDALLARAGLRAAAPFSAALDPATLDRVGPDAAAPIAPFAAPDGPDLLMPCTWFARKEAATGAEGWREFREAWGEELLGPQLGAMRLVGGGHPAGPVRAEPGYAPGLLLFGPYLRLSPGSYRLLLSAVPLDGQGGPERPALSVTVTTPDRRSFGSRRVNASLLGGEPVEIGFGITEVDAPGGLSEPLEFLVSAEGDAGFEIRALDLARAAEGSQALGVDLLPQLSLAGSARREGDAVAVDAQAPSGHVLYGPYLPLPAGAYAVELALRAHGQPRAHAVAVEIVLGGEVVAERRARVADLAQGPLRMEFRVGPEEIGPNGTSAPFELRVSHLGEAGLRVEGARLTGG
ncbi:hypothetical protein [Arenibaculum pallidiluteum]|uniref:hypothetical protein n=1 Tax=Arenibaculum pallidiluteum TaxID=2812559 RepID=UPI001A95B109|nr:hypothetical protein [Arenibaculum pallidiluteum]